MNDTATSELLTYFYRELRNTPVSKAVALQRVQQKLIADRSYGTPSSVAAASVSMGTSPTRRPRPRTPRVTLGLASAKARRLVADTYRAL